MGSRCDRAFSFSGAPPRRPRPAYHPVHLLPTDPSDGLESFAVSAAAAASTACCHRSAAEEANDLLAGAPPAEISIDFPAAPTSSEADRRACAGSPPGPLLYFADGRPGAREICRRLEAQVAGGTGDIEPADRGRVRQSASLNRRAGSRRLRTGVVVSALVRLIEEHAASPGLEGRWPVLPGYEGALAPSAPAGGDHDAPVGGGESEASRGGARPGPTPGDTMRPARADRRDRSQARALLNERRRCAIALGRIKMELALPIIPAGPRGGGPGNVQRRTADRCSPRRCAGCLKDHRRSRRIERVATDRGREDGLDRDMPWDPPSGGFRRTDGGARQRHGHG